MPENGIKKRFNHNFPQPKRVQKSVFSLLLKKIKTNAKIMKNDFFKKNI